MKKIVKIKYVLFFLIALLLTACNSTRTKVVKTNHKTNSKINAPEWFKTPPSAKNYLFAVSTARSTHADYAINKGLQNAYAEMSRIVQSHLDGVVLHLVEEYGNDYYSRLQSASQLVSKNTIAGIRVVKQEIIQQGPYYYTFFLAAIPVSGVNSSFKKKLSEIVGLNTNASSSKIFAVSNKNTNLLKMTNLHKISGSHSYPEWFLNENKVTEGKTIIGYAPKAYYKDNAANAAIENGIWNYLLFNGNKISGAISNVLAKEQDFLAQDKLKETVDTSRFEMMMQNLIPLDTAFVNDFCLVILGDGTKLNKKQIKKITKMPEWIINIPEEKGFAYVVGIAPKYHYEKSSWLEAEADGRKKLALRQQLQIESIMAKQHGKYEEVNRLIINAKIDKARVVSRFRNKYMMFVLIKMPLNS